ncbi:MAG: isocitrate lyase/PEP mutase family protein [Burkholderiales bacterium]|jgi:2-methylisocitrate lyase-like PEP mutase family enzyme
MSQANHLRALLRAGKLIVAPGAVDGITARAIDRAGFPAAYMTGAGTSATLGYPDYGLTTMTEMVANASRIVNSISIPLISDADTGYGNELNVYRTVQEFERAGVAAIHIEDQVFPKRCGHLDNKEVTSREDYVAKIRAAAAARRSKDFTIIARTDSRAVLGFEEAIARANLALANGADVAFVEAPQTLEEVAAVPRRVNGPCLLNVVRAGRTPEIPLAEAERLGYAIAILPGVLLLGIIEACDAILADVKRLGTHPPTMGKASPAQIFARFGAAEWDARRTEFRDPIDEADAMTAKAETTVPAK